MSARYVAAAAAVAVGLGYYCYLRRRQPVVLITGASGYLGHHVLTALADDARYRLHGTFHGAEQFVARWARQCVCHRIALDDPAAVRSLVARVRPDVVIHLAAISSPAKAEADPARAPSPARAPRPPRAGRPASPSVLRDATTARRESKQVRIRFEIQRCTLTSAMSYMQTPFPGRGGPSVDVVDDLQPYSAVAAGTCSRRGTQ